MIFNGKEYFVDVVTYDDDKNEHIKTVADIDEARFFIENSLKSGEINENVECKVMLSEKNFDTEAIDDAFWEGETVDLSNLDESMDHAAWLIPNDLTDNSIKYRGFLVNAYECRTRLVLSYKYNGQAIQFYRDFKDVVEMNRFIREHKDQMKMDPFDEGYYFTVEIIAPDDVSSCEQLVLSSLDLEPNSIRTITTGEIMNLIYDAIVAKYCDVDIDNFEVEADNHFLSL